MSVRKSILVGALLACSVATIAIAQTNPAKHSHFRHDGAMLDRSFMHAVHQLNLTADQQSKIDTYLKTAHQGHQHQGHQSADGSRRNVDALANPGDPYFSTAVEEAKALAANRIQQSSDLEVKIYNVLTRDQQAKLPQVLADMKAERIQHRGERKERHEQARDEAPTAG